MITAFVTAGHIDVPLHRLTALMLGVLGKTCNALNGVTSAKYQITGRKVKKNMLTVWLGKLKENGFNKRNMHYLNPYSRTVTLYYIIRLRGLWYTAFKKKLYMLTDFKTAMLLHGAFVGQHAWPLHQRLSILCGIFI